MSDLDDISRARVQRQRRIENAHCHAVASEIAVVADAIIDQILAEDYNQDKDGVEIVLQLAAMAPLRAAAVCAVVMETLVNECGVCYLDLFVNLLWKHESGAESEN